MPLNSWISSINPERDVDLIQYVRFIGRYDRHTEDLTKAGSEDEQPDQRAQGASDKALTLMQEAQAFPPDDSLRGRWRIRPAQTPSASVR